MATNSNTIRLKLTAAAIAQKLTPPPPEIPQTVIYDTEVIGFGAYRTSEEPGRYFVHFRIGSRQRKKTIARVTEMNVVDARAEAIQLKLAGRKGQDLLRERKLALERGVTLQEAYSAFLLALERKGGSPATFENYRKNWENGLQPHSRRPLCEITKADIRSWHSGWGKRGPTVANQTLRLFRALYNHALRTTDGLPPNPTIAVDPFKERLSRPILTWEMLPAWINDVKRLENPIRRAFWPFLLFSGLRKTDAINIRWDEVFDDRLHRPNPKGGRHRAFDLPLSSKLSQILIEAQEAHAMMFPKSIYVFPADSISGHIEAAREKTIPFVSPHMLRRTFATACVEAGLDPYTTKRLLNHRVASGDVTSLYIQQSSTFLQEKMEELSKFIEQKTKLEDVC